MFKKGGRSERANYPKEKNPGNGEEKHMPYQNGANSKWNFHCIQRAEFKEALTKSPTRSASPMLVVWWFGAGGLVPEGFPIHSIQEPGVEIQIQTETDRHRHKHKRTNTHTNTNTHTHKNTNTQTREHTHTSKPTRTHIQAQAQSHAHTQGNMKKMAHTQEYTKWY